MFLVILHDKMPTALNTELLEAHIEFLKTVHATGRMPICGPFMDNQRALFILDCASLRDAEQIVKKDPFIIQGYYRSYTISEFIYAHEGNNWLIDSEQTKANLS